MQAEAPGACILRGSLRSHLRMRNQGNPSLFSRRIFLRPSFVHGTARKLPQKQKGGRSAERRIRITNRATPTDVTACRCFGRGGRHGRSALPRASASGALAFRRSVAALARLLPLAQLRAALTGILQRSLRHCKPLLLASSSRPGRCAGEAGSEAARERFARPRAGAAAHSTPQIASRSAPW
jgi:hypothetical protein